MRQVCWLFVFIFYNSEAQSVSTKLGGRSSGIGNATATLSDEWAVFNNPAGLAKVEEISIAYAYDFRPSLEGANRMGAAMVLPAKYGTAALAAFKFGDRLYSEHLLSLAFGHRIGITSLGAKINYVQYQTELFGSHYALTFDFGGITQLTNKFYIGCYILNFTTATLNTHIPQTLPTLMTAGLGYEISPNVLLMMEAEKNLSVVKPTLRNGVEYNFHKKFFIRTGFSLFPTAGFFGFGLNKYGFKIDYGMSYSAILLFNYQASVVYRLKRKK